MKCFFIAAMVSGMMTANAQSSKFYISAGAYSLVDTYRDLVYKVNTCECVSSV